MTNYDLIETDRVNFVPACGGTEVPFRMRGRQLLYVWDQSGQLGHRYLDVDTDLILTDEEVSELFLGYRETDHVGLRR